jgi:hypothetical protein
VALLMVGATSAYASNAGDPDQGFPPCDQQSVSVHNQVTMHDPSNGAVMGVARIDYSAGCQTEWVKVDGDSPYYPASASVWMQNQTGTDLYETLESGEGEYWTYQLGNMKYQTGCGGAQMYNALAPGTGYVTWVYLGCY